MRNPLTLEAFAEFCESKPADEEYAFTSPSRCACGQYASSLGIGPEWIWDHVQFGRFWSDPHVEASRMPRTFGALAARLRAAIAEAR